MYLIPTPKKILSKQGEFRVYRNTEIVLESRCTFDDLNSALLLQKEAEKNLGIKLKINKSFSSNIYNNSIVFRRVETAMNIEAYILNIENNRIDISAYGQAGLFYGVQTLIQIIRQYGNKLPNIYIEDEPYFKNRGFYHDITRGKVPKLETLKELVDKAAFYKINQLQLYIEHTFAFKNMSEVWFDKDPLTAEDILILDMYCKKRHIELVPSLSTFGHLYEVLRTKSYSSLCELENSDKEEYSFIDRMAHHTLDVSNEESINLVCKILNEFIPLFSSNKFNICCDETLDLGRGKSKFIKEEKGVGKIYVEFLNKIIDIVKKHNKKVMFWGDVILHHDDLINEIPSDVICLNWNYDPNVKENDTKKIAEYNRNQYVCPGVAGWSKLMNYMDNGFENINRMISYGVKYNAIGVLNTDWGDYGHINLLSASIPGMAYGASLSWNPNIEKDFEYTYKALSIIEYGDESLKVVSILNKLSKSQIVSWSELVRWKELYDKDLNIKVEFSKLKVDQIRAGYEKAYESHLELLDLSNKVINKIDLQELIVSSKGIMLINEFFLILLKREFNKFNFKPINKSKDLAEMFEMWFYDYSSVWIKRNKESELYRIKEIIIYACRYLREI